jgi:hypothetical protein
MKNCPNCQAEVETNFDVCWKCLYNFSEQKVITTPELGQSSFYSTINCLRCSIPMVFGGTRKIQDRQHWSTIGNLVELLSNKDSFDLFVCPQCGKVEFFIELPD